MSNYPPLLPLGGSGSSGSSNSSSSHLTYHGAPAPPSSYPSLPAVNSAPSPHLPPHHYNSYQSHHNGSIGHHQGPGNPGVGVNDLYQPSSPGPPTHSMRPLPSMRTIDSFSPPPPHGMAQYHPPDIPSGPLPFLHMRPPYGYVPQHFESYPPNGVHAIGDIRMSSYNFSHLNRNKKDIKRRTKTGCKTCRKRRIKCDEAHPTCNNCKKSKRECAGYDPIFKQQPNNPAFLELSTHTSHHIPQAATATSTSYAGLVHSPPHAPYTPTGALAPAAATTAAARSPSSHSRPPPLSLLATGLGSPTSHSHAYGASGSASASSTTSHRHGSSSSLSTGLYTSWSIVSPPDASGPAPYDLPRATAYRAKMKVAEIIDQGGPAPPSPSGPLSHERIDDIKRAYYDIYVHGLSSFFETSWYNFKPSGTTNPVSILLNNTPLMGLLSAFLDTTSRVQSPDSKSPEMIAASSQELRIVWQLASMAYATPATVNLPSDEPVAGDNATEARNRLAVIEALFSGGHLRTNPCMPPPQTGEPQRQHELEFWWWLAEYLRLQDDTGLPSPPGNSLPRQREQALGQMRTLLDMRENRDVIYSVAILRDMAPRFLVGNDVTLPPHSQDESDPRSKFALAAKFIRSEAQVEHGGTTNVVRRFAELAVKAFIQPGYSVSRI